jgi:hypothetical protein
MQRKLRKQLERIVSGELDEEDLMSMRSEPAFMDAGGMPAGTEADRVAERANQLASKGHFSRAMQALINDRMAELTAEAVDVLCGKFPQRWDPLPELPPITPIMQIEPTLVRSVVSKVANGSAACINGFTGELLQHAIEGSEAVKSAISHLICDALNDELSDSAVERLLLQRLIAIDKSSPSKLDLRPIGISSPILKMIEHVAWRTTPQSAVALALPRIQLGVGVRGGCEIVAALLQNHLHIAKENQLEHLIIKRDGRNAFNTMKRSAIARKLFKHPELNSMWQLFRLMYTKQPPKMAIYDPHTRQLIAVLQALTGVIQGTVSGSFFYCLGQQEVLESVADRHPECSPLAIIDDIVIPGPVDEAIAFYQELSVEMEAQCGVSANHEKAQVLWCGLGEPPEEVVEKCKRAGLPAPSHRIEALGIMISEIRAKLHEDLEAKLLDMKTAMDRLKNPAIALQNRLNLLRFCCSTKLNYLARCLPPSHIGSFLQRSDEELVTFLLDEVHATPSERNLQRVREQLGLPIKMGGLGIRPTLDNTSLAAWWSSQALAASHIKAEREKLKVDACREVDDELRAVWHGLRSAGIEFDELFPDLGPDDEPAAVGFFDFYATKKVGKLQHFLTLQMDKRKHSKLVEKARHDGKQQDEARLQALHSNPSCRLPLVTIPRRPEHRIHDGAMRGYLRDRLGLKTHPDLPDFCFCCGQGPGPGPGPGDPLHHYKCNRPGAWVAAHDHVVGVLGRVAEEAGLVTKLIDKDRDHAMYKHNHHVVPDIETTHDGKISLIDVTMTTCEPAVYCGKSEKQIADVQLRAEQRKIKKFTEVTKQKQAAFFPFAIERNTLAFGKHARILIDLLSFASITSGHRILSPFLIKATIAAAVCRANANLVRCVLNKNMEAARRQARRLEADEET